MLARYQAGDLPGALAAYHHTRAALAAELGTDPGPALAGLLGQILHRDPRLEPLPPAPRPGARARPGLAGRRSPEVPCSHHD
jgi:DNA-binding SARP family transcriptional activator